VYTGSSSGEILDNHIRGAGVGVWLDGSSNTAVTRNRVRDSATWGIALQNGSSNNSVSRNVITGSGEYDLVWDETGDGNQWIENRCHTSNPVGLCEP
jgi:parallel beta-helix repeat protein